MNITVPDKLIERYNWLKRFPALQESTGFILEILAEDRKGLLADITSLISSLKGDISYIQTWIEHNGNSHIIVQIKNVNLQEQVCTGLTAIHSILKINLRSTFHSTYGKRVIILGGGSQVAMVASGAISEADRHNIRGEKISVDTIAVVGETEIANAVLSVGTLHRAAILVLAGALMGGEINRAVKELREDYGIPVISLKMAGSVNRITDLVVTDPGAAGVMAVMLISHIGKFDLLKIMGREF